MLLLSECITLKNGLTKCGVLGSLKISINDKVKQFYINKYNRLSSVKSDGIQHDIINCYIFFYIHCSLYCNFFHI